MMSLLDRVLNTIIRSVVGDAYSWKKSHAFMKGRLCLSNQVIKNNLSKGHMVFCAKTSRKLLSMFLTRKKKNNLKKIKQVQDERVLVQMNNWLKSRKESRDGVLVGPHS